MYSATISTTFLAVLAAVTAVHGAVLPPLFGRAPAACKTHLVHPAPTNYICGSPLHLHYLSGPSVSNADAAVAAADVADPSPLIAHTADLTMTDCMSSCFNDTGCISFGFLSASQHSLVSSLEGALQQNHAGEVHAGAAHHGRSVCWTFRHSLRHIGFTRVTDLHAVVGADTQFTQYAPHYWNRHCWEATGDACPASSSAAPAAAAPLPTSSSEVVPVPVPAPVTTSVVAAAAPTSTAVDTSVTAITSYTGTTTIYTTLYTTRTILETTGTVTATV